jgi:hypothetical protein
MLHVLVGELLLLVVVTGAACVAAGPMEAFAEMCV